MRFYRATSASWTDDSTNIFVALDRYLDQLFELSNALDAPSADSYALVQQLSGNLRLLRDRQIRVQDDSINLSQPAPGDSWRIDRLLDSPLPSSTARRKWLAIARDVDVEIVSNLKLDSIDTHDDEWERRRQHNHRILQQAILSREGG